MAKISMNIRNLIGNFLFDDDPVHTGLIGHHAGYFGDEGAKIYIFDYRLPLAPELKNGLGDIRASRLSLASSC